MLDTGLYRVPACGACVYMRYRRHSIDLPTKAFVGVAGTAFFLQLPLSAALWKWLPFLFLVQFPFRSLALLAGTLPLVLLSKTTPRWVLVGTYILLGALASIPFYRYRHQSEDFRPMASLLSLRISRRMDILERPSIRPSEFASRYGMPMLLLL